LLIAFGELLDEVEWMEQSAKMEAKAKVGILRRFMGFPEWLENKTSVEEFYNGVRLLITMQYSYYYCVII